MSVHRRWNPTDLAKAASVSVNQIYAWYHEGLLEGDIDRRGILRLPLPEAVAVYALRDGEDPQAARDELMAGRPQPFVHTPPRQTEQEIEDSLQDVLVGHRLPQPNRHEIGDTRREAE